MARNLIGRVGVMIVTLLLATPVIAAQSAEAQAAQGGRYFADAAFQRIWERNDRPVELLQTDRSWTWGPNSFFNGSEPYKQGRDGKRLVQYFDKSRMEINDPGKDPADPDFVTNGLLVRELVSGKIAKGDGADEVEARNPSKEAVAGDPASVNENAPTYESFREVASLAGDRPADSRVGLKVRQTYNKKSQVGDLPREQEALGELAKIAVFDPVLRHNIPDKFWNFMTQTGPVYEGGKTVQNGSVYQRWEFFMGLPITEPYWVKTKVASVERWVMVQLFERRVLTYTPANRPGFEVEMGNAGQHYYRWRYQVPDENNSTDGGGSDRPEIQDLSRTALTATSARVEWSTSKPTTSRLEYGTTQDMGSLAGQTKDLITDHAVDITGLTPSTVYYFRVISRDRDGRVVDDTVHSFKTLAA